MFGCLPSSSTSLSCKQHCLPAALQIQEKAYVCKGQDRARKRNYLPAWQISLKCNATPWMLTPTQAVCFKKTWCFSSSFFHSLLLLVFIHTGMPEHHSGAWMQPRLLTSRQNISYFLPSPAVLFGIFYVLILNHSSANHCLPGLLRILPFNPLIPILLLQGKTSHFL